MRIVNVEGKYYNLLMGSLAIIVVITTIIEINSSLSGLEAQIISFLNSAIWIIFVGDYVYRFVQSDSKKRFLLNNKIDLISIIPLNEVFKTLRILKIGKMLKLLKVFRTMIFFSRFKKSFGKFIKTNNFHLVLYATIIIVFLGTIGISLVEKMSLSDSLWWSFVTTTTVGYGDISPTTDLGRIIAGALMILGIGFIGMLTGTIATFFIKSIDTTLSYKQNVIEDIKERLDNIDELTKEDLKDINKVLEALIEEKEI
ncbi:MAG: potassium channel family protein [Clostridium sp.]